MDSRQAGIALLIVGAIAIVLGLAVYAGLLSWFGRLPGDIHYKIGNLTVYAPIGSMLLISIGLSAGYAILRRLL